MLLGLLIVTIAVVRCQTAKHAAGSHSDCLACPIPVSRSESETEGCMGISWCTSFGTRDGKVWFGPVLRFCRTSDRTVGSVQNGPVQVLNASEP